MHKNTDNKFKIGDTVVAKVNKEVKLIVTDYSDRTYHCKIAAEPDKKELIYFERELVPYDKQVFTLKITENLLRLFGIVK